MFRFSTLPALSLRDLLYYILAVCALCNRVSLYEKNDPCGGWCELGRETSSIPHSPPTPWGSLGQRSSPSQGTCPLQGLTEGGCEKVSNCGKHELVSPCCGFRVWLFLFSAVLSLEGFPPPAQEGEATPGCQKGLGCSHGEPLVFMFQSLGTGWRVVP